MSFLDANDLREVQKDDDVSFRVECGGNVHEGVAESVLIATPSEDGFDVLSIGTYDQTIEAAGTVLVWLIRNNLFHDARDHALTILQKMAEEAPGGDAPPTREH